MKTPKKAESIKPLNLWHEKQTLYDKRLLKSLEGDKHIAKIMVTVLEFVNVLSEVGNKDPQVPLTRHMVEINPGNSIIGSGKTAVTKAFGKLKFKKGVAKTVSLEIADKEGLYLKLRDSTEMAPPKNVKPTAKNKEVFYSKLWANLYSKLQAAEFTAKEKEEGHQHQYCPIGIAFMRKRGKLETQIALRDLKEVKMYFFEKCMYITFSPDFNKDDLDKYAVIIQRLDDGLVGVIDPHFPNPAS
jgi:hypothetical protein